MGIDQHCFLLLVSFVDDWRVLLLAEEAREREREWLSSNLKRDKLNINLEKIVYGATMYQ